MASLIKAIIDFLRDSIEGDPDEPAPPGKLAAIDGIRNRLTNLNIDNSHNGLTDWLDEFDVTLRDTILVRVLQVRAPRTSAF
jgi:hypothetical protein